LGWYAGVMFWQYRNDADGNVVKTACGNLVSLYQGGSGTSDSTNNSTTDNSTSNSTTNNSTSNSSSNSTTNNSTSNSTITPSTVKVSYPIRFSYINSINSWWPATAIAAALGVPGYAKPHTYNYIAFSTWNTNGAVEVASIWAKPTYFLGTDSVFGSTD
jgi:hypothetical protein